MRAIRWGGAAVVMMLVVGLAVASRPVPTPQTAPATSAGPKGKLVIAGLGSKMLVRNYSWGLEASDTGGGGTGGGTGETTFSAMKVEKPIDTNSTELADAVANGTHFQTATLTIFKPGTNDPLSIFKLSDALVGAVEHSYKSSNVETVTVFYRTIEWTYKAPDADQKFCWDLDLHVSCV